MYFWETGRNTPANGQSLVHQGCEGHFPTITNLSKTLRIRNTHVIKKDLVEAAVTIGLLNRPNVDTVALHIQEEHRQASMFGNVRVSTGNQNTVVTMLGARGPNLLTVDHPSITIFNRFGAKPGKVAATMGV